MIFFSLLVKTFSDDLNTSFAVTYYNVLKFKHMNTGTFLSTFEENYINGSGQQIVYAINTPVLAETFWTILPLENQKNINQNDFITCGSTVLLESTFSHKYLHSGSILSSISNGNEVSCTNDINEGNKWKLICDGVLTTDKKIVFEHFTTGKYLSVNISGQYPVEMGGFDAYCSNSADNEWSIAGGVFAGGDQ